MNQEKESVEILETGDYLELAPLFKASGLEVHLEGDAPKGFLTCWKAVDHDGKPAGGVTIEYKGGEYVIGDIAVREELRDKDIGTLLVNLAMERIKALGGSRIYLVAKAPKFFEKFGFTYLKPEEAPDIFNCKNCDMLGVSCYPEFMTLKKL